MTTPHWKNFLQSLDLALPGTPPLSTTITPAVEADTEDREPDPGGLFTPAHRIRIPDGTPIAIGQRVHCILYGGNNGIVTAIHGTQDPASIRRIGPVITCGSTAQFTVLFHDHTSHISEGIIRGVQWHLYAEIVPPGLIDAATRFRQRHQAWVEREATRQKIASDRRRAESTALYTAAGLETIQQASQRPGRPISPRVLATRNIRHELKAAFPGIKFSITSKTFSGGDSIDIYWELGPIDAAVAAITGKYQEGHFNGMEDIYEYDRDDVFTDIFGGAKYVHTNHRLHEESHLTICRDLCRAYKLPIPENDQFWNIPIPDSPHRDDIGSLARQILLAHAFPPGARITGARRISNPAATRLADYWQVISE